MDGAGTKSDSNLRKQMNGGAIGAILGMAKVMDLTWSCGIEPWK
jgi:hypothetical protein